MRPPKALAAVLVLAAVSVACGKAAAPGSDPGSLRAPDSLILRVSTGGGFVMPNFALGQMPEFTLSGDGRVFTLGAQIEIYPPPALPPLMVRRVTAEGVAHIVEEAHAAGLDGEDKAYAYDVVADAPTTTFTYVDDAGKTHTISAYALGMESGQGSPGPGEPAGQDREARAKLAELRDKLLDLSSWLPAGSAGEDKPADVDAMRIYSSAYGPQSQPKQSAKAWPLSTPLSQFGKTYNETFRCGTVSGADLDKLRAEARTANTLTPWASEGKEYALIWRPLLPDESGCPTQN